MGMLIELSMRHQARALILRPRISASICNVMPFKRRRPASSTIPVQCEDGMLPRDRQLLTTGGSIANSLATMAVPPRASMSESASNDALAIPAGIFTFCEFVKLHDMAIAQIPAFAHASGMKRRHNDIGRRLSALRAALDNISQAELCRQIKCSTNRWNQYESGERRITVEIAMRLAARFGVSLDWIYRDDPRLLPQELYKKIYKTAA
jgi:DNA-binding XRE family transcriptional regulator